MNMTIVNNQNGYKILLVSACIACGANAMLSSRVKKYLEMNHHLIVNDINAAEYVVINGCGVTQWHENYSKNIIDKYVKKNKKVILIGCLSKIADKKNLAQFYHDVFEKHFFIISDLSELDDIFLTNTRIKEIIFSSHIGSTSVLSYNENQSRYAFFWDITLSLVKLYLRLLSYFGFTNIKLTAFQEMNVLNNTLSIEIAKGCKGNCSYCVIKKAKGNLSSRKVEEIINDISSHDIKNRKDIKTIHLIADDCGCYGHDINGTLLKLIQAIHEKFPHVAFHIPYLNPQWVWLHWDEWNTLFSNHAVSALNFPIQSASDKILKLMNRGYSFVHVKEFVTQIRKISPNTFIITHIMVGFPGENWIDFLKTLKAIFYFDFAHIITYSDREGTTSCLFENKISSFTKICRFFIVSIFLYVNFLKHLFLSVRKVKDKIY